MKKGSSLIVTFDGLRRDRVTDHLMPHLASFMVQGTDFVNSRSVFPSETRVAVTSTMTGCPPGEHGLVANQFIHPVVKDRPFKTALYEDLMAADAVGQLIDRLTLGQRLAAAGKSMVVVSTASQGATWMMNSRARDLGQSVFSMHGEPVSTKSLHDAAVAYAGPVPQAATPNDARLDYAATVLMDVVYPQWDPDVCVFWMNDPDMTSHAFGISAPETEIAQRRCDEIFGRILEWWRAGHGPENIMIMSDHGQITGSRQFDPASVIPAEWGRLSSGSFNGLYLNERSPAHMAKVVSWLREQPWCGLIFAHSQGKAVEGAFPWTAVRGGHPRGADVGFTLRATDCSSFYGPDQDACLFTSYIEPGGGMHGGLNRGELSTVLAAQGPAFRARHRSLVPCWLPDIAPTLLTILGLNLEGTGGRSLLEGLTGEGLGSAPYGVEPKVAERVLECHLNGHEQYLRQWDVEGRTIIDCGWTSGRSAWVS